MVKKSLLRSLSVVMACMMAVMTVACGANTVTTDTASIEATVEEKEAQTLEQTLVARADAAVSGEAGKVETVYVTADANGAVNDVIVSEWLKNANASSELSDTTELKDIVNVKGNETFKDNGDGTVTWDANGSDIYYQGTTDKELPVDVKITYTLDGKEISPEDLAGKSGKVTIRFDYDNKAKQTVDVDGKDIEVYTPFAMVSGMMLDSDKFSNVEISNGKVISDGGKYIVMGVALPGLKESLDISDDKWDELEDAEEIQDKLSNHFEITADTNDFEMGMTVTMASSDLLSDFGVTDLTGSDKIEDLKSDMNELNDGSTKLVDGTKELKDGTTKLRDGSKELYDGTGKLYDGTKELKDGTGRLVDGTGKLADGAGQLKDGTGKLADGAGQLKDGTGKLADGAAQLSQGTKDLSDGTKTLSAGTGELSQGSKTLYGGIKQYTEGVAQVNEGATKLAAGAASAEAGSKQVAAGIQSAHAGSTGLANGMSQLAAGVSQINALAEKLPVLLQKKQEMESQKAALEATYSFLIGGTAECSDVVLDTLQKLTYDESTGASAISTKEYAVLVRDAGLAAKSGTNQGSVSVDPAGAENEVVTAIGGVLFAEDNDDEAAKASSEASADNSSEDNSTEDESEDDSKEDESDDKEAGNSEEGLGSEDDENAGAGAGTGSGATEGGSAGGSEEEPSEGTPSETPASDSDNSTVKGGNGDELTFTQEGLNALIQSKVNEALKVAQAEFEKQAAEKTAQMTAEVTQKITLISTYSAVFGATRASISVLSQVLDAFNGFDLSQEKLAQLSQLSEGVTQLVKGSQKLDAGLGQLETSYGALDTGIGSLKTGAQQLSAGTGKLVQNNETLVGGAAKLDAGISQVDAGAKKLDNGAGQLKSGADQLKSGADQLNTGAGDLKNGADQLNDGAETLRNGVNELNDGAATLNNGAGDLMNGAKDLNEGAGKLNDGIIELDDGVVELLEGMCKLDSEGIKKLYDAFDGDISDFADKMTAIQKASSNYTSFAGAGIDEKSSVKFIIKTEGVKVKDL